MTILAFIILLGVAGYIIFKRFSLVSSAIKLGKAADYTDRPAERLGTMLRIAFAQKKMFDRPIVGIMHLVIYLGFIIVNIELLEIILDGLTGHHRLFAPFLGGFYDFLINTFEFFAVGVIVVCVIFFVRRNVITIARFHSRELTSWPRSDANTILIWEVVLMSLFLTMNAADNVLQAKGVEHYSATSSFLFSQFLEPLYTNWSATSLEILERTAWWIHITGILGFAAYITWSKHLHVLLAFPNTYFSRLDPAGHISNMPRVTSEVRLMIDPSAPAPDATETPEKFGAADINDLTWKNLMDAYSCTECGRCSSVCPANITGKLLSPRAIMMSTRDRAEEVSTNLSKGKPGLDDGKKLVGDYISKEELFACTTCNACVDACPINISPLEIIVEMRRFVAMEESATPASWNSMFTNIENNGAPWAYPASDRINWTTKV
jgi:heterodisulfide reductase subunit C